MENQLENWLTEYLEKYNQALKVVTGEIILPIISKFVQSCKEEKQIFVFGNGGSASNASHFVTDFTKGAADAVGKKIRAISLNENVSLMTAISNDYAFEDVYSRQLANLAKPGDTVFTLSVSGNSPNLVKAVEWANENDLHSIALVGGKKGKLYDIAKQSVVVDSLHYGHVEDIHMLICHIITYAFMENPDIVDVSNN
ncbi:MAG: SIS domain-containing protein [Prolixibacteraceae bacterium]|jgi:D-sedoheptulose 7-phosphate isomerase|nr:SIS domain-containing protein [Prolixibacteraceae bacterium]MBT6004909.1 SIS domain-containing protein [Prolixibacteraceae bacterium]MBT6998494.1 SIS domain-containing protein [Prolixibacteraceae bacterium]MBT7397135.1 SIS domain-containing protein [Prolixibacteraceae bacterium]